MKVALDFASDMALKSNGSFIPYSPIEDHRQKRMRVYAKVLGEAVEDAVRLASSPPRRRAIKLRALMCMQPPYLTFDGEAKDPVEPTVLTSASPSPEDASAGGGTTTVGSSSAYVVSLDQDAGSRDDPPTEVEPPRLAASPEGTAQYTERLTETPVR